MVEIRIEFHCYVSFLHFPMSKSGHGRTGCEEEEEEEFKIKEDT